MSTKPLLLHQHFCCLVVSNNVNPDMDMYFSQKIAALGEEPDLFFAGNSHSQQADCLDIVTSRTKANRVNIYGLFSDLRIAASFTIFLRKKKVNVVHFDNVHVSNMLQLFIVRAMGRKLSVTVHDTYPHEGPRATLTRFYNLLCKYMAHKIIVFSEQTYFNHEKVVKLSLSGFSWKGNLLETWRDPRIALFFGRIESYKGLEFLPKICRQVKSKNPSIEFIVAGQGRINNLQALLDEDITVVNRFIEDDKLLELMRDSFCVILPYKSATQSGVIPLANSYGRPVVAFHVGNMAESIDSRNGVLVEPYDIDSFSDAILALFDLSKDPKRSRALEERFEEEFGMLRAEEDARKLFEKLRELVCLV